jgi:putative transcription factor
MNSFDTAPVNIGRGGAPGKPVVVPTNARELDALKQKGVVVTELKHGAGSNSSAHGSSVNARALEESEETRHVSVDASLSKAIMQARMAKKMTQKDLATAINEKAQVVGDYEAGRGIPNPQIISKLERALNCKLPRPQKPKKQTDDDAPSGGGGGGGAAKKPAANTHGGLTRGGPPRA